MYFIILYTEGTGQKNIEAQKTSKEENLKIYDTSKKTCIAKNATNELN